MLYQLSYTPKQQILSFIELPYEHRDTALETAALPAELCPYMSLPDGFSSKQSWWTIRDSNPGPTGYEPVALTN